jgi:hypothetical protein
MLLPSSQVFPIRDLADLVEMVYKVLRLIEKIQASGTLRVCHIESFGWEMFFGCILLEFHF